MAKKAGERERKGGGRGGERNENGYRGIGKYWLKFEDVTLETPRTQIFKYLTPFNDKEFRNISRI